jgi:hypothetical protein
MAAVLKTAKAFARLRGFESHTLRVYPSRPAQTPVPLVGGRLALSQWISSSLAVWGRIGGKRGRPGPRPRRDSVASRLAGAAADRPSLDGGRPPSRSSRRRAFPHLAAIDTCEPLRQPVVQPAGDQRSSSSHQQRSSNATRSGRLHTVRRLEFVGDSLYGRRDQRRRSELVKGEHRVGGVSGSWPLRGYRWH